jgi:hypothetical protein
MAEIREILTLEASIAESGPLGSATIAIPVDAKLLEKIKAKDSDPQFITLEIESGESQNGRVWTPQIMESIASQVNFSKPVGYKGHISKEDDPYVLPDPHTLWVGATTARKGDKTVLYVKGYLKSQEIRDYVDLEMVNSVSVRGDSTLRPQKGGKHEVVNFTLESIDWTRKGRNGMSNRVVGITSEMTEGGNSVEPRDIAALSEEELRLHNPLLVQSIETKTKNPLETKISEMETTVGEIKPQVETVAEIRKKLGLDDNADVIVSVQELLDKVTTASKSAVQDFIQDTIKTKVKDEKGQRLVMRLIGEMKEFHTQPLTAETKKEIETKINEKVEKDDDVKAVISEMNGTRRPETGGTHMGGRSSTTNERQERSTGRITVRKRKL